MRPNILTELSHSETGYCLVVTVPNVGKLTWQFEFLPAVGDDDALAAAAALLVLASTESDPFIAKAIGNARR